MRTNPFSDALDFLTQGDWPSYVFWLLTIASMMIAVTQVSAQFCTCGIGWPDSLLARCGGSSPYGSSRLLTLITLTALVVCATGWAKWRSGPVRDCSGTS
jgi:hypothetical protein